MIEGLQIDVKSEELLKLLKERLDHHEKKAVAYEKNAVALGVQIKDIEEDMEFGKVSGGTPVERLQQKAREHKDLAGYYKFMVDHVIQNDTYRLNQEDLRRLGIAVRVY